MPIDYNFEWRIEKARSNQGQHEEAATVFTDPMALTTLDPDHSDGEDRWITMGISTTGRLLVVVHTFIEDNERASTIRIISSRRAGRSEHKEYGER